MADMTLCNGTHCKDKETCKRFTTPGDELYQSIFDPTLDEEKDKDSCEYYIVDRKRVHEKHDREVKK